MREVTKSMMSLSWAMSLFGLRQMTSLLMPQSWRSAASSFDAVTRCTEGQLGASTDSLFRAGDNLQRGLVDLMFNMFTLGMGGGNAARRVDRWAADATRRSANAGDSGADFVQRTAQAGADALRQSADAIDPGASYGGREDVGWGPMPGSH